MKITLAIVLIALACSWVYIERRELVMRINIMQSAGEPPALIDALDEHDNTKWLDDYFTVEEIAADTFAIGEPRYLQQNFSYLIIGRDQALLFDAGPGIRDIRKAAEKLTDKPIVFLPSHFHYDHVGNSVTFDEIAVVDLPHIRSRAKHNRLTLTDMEHLGGAEGFSAPTWEVDHWWPVGHVIKLGARELTLLYTPGHTTDSIALWDEKHGLLFSGDFVYPGPLYGFLPNSSMSDYLSSTINLLRALPQGTLLVGAHRAKPPGVPTLLMQDLLDLQTALEQLKAGQLRGEGSYPQSFKINQRMTMLAEPRWLQDW